jgi:hypothetical protein
MLMVDPGIKAGFARFQTRWRDPLLTTLTIMLGIMLFVLAPLHAAGVVKSENFGLALILICTAALFVVSGSPLTIVAVLVAVGFAAVAAVLRLRRIRLSISISTPPRGPFSASPSGGRSRVRSSARATSTITASWAPSCSISPSARRSLPSIRSLD